MKYILALFFFISAGQVFAQSGMLPLDQEKNIYYSDSGQPKLSKDEIYKKMQDWVSNTFGNYQNAVTFEDAAAGKLRVTSYVPVIHADYAYVRFDLTISCADNQYQAVISNLDGISTIHSPVRLSAKDNERISAKEVLAKAENSRKKRGEMEDELKLIKADNEGINTAMYNLLASIKQFTN
ncbi:DUF4468 domain-containing protein [Dyadobacter crusticola]|uniref:DUF4468 domain-containing protein n=1 Tax=Dyadobacter crusticola TaxID=292407 RepID=UPI00054EF995|nr:DUF4468 domain-containing protein [Dyadobacter crusticola]